jgi:hypothetical protein
MQQNIIRQEQMYVTKVICHLDFYALERKVLLMHDWVFI